MAITNGVLARRAAPALRMTGVCRLFATAFPEQRFPGTAPLLRKTNSPSFRQYRRVDRCGLETALWYRMPLEASRPHAAHVEQKHRGALQWIDARLWEDPLQVPAARAT